MPLAAADAENPGSANLRLHVFQKARRAPLARVDAQAFVSATSDPKSVAGFLSSSIREAPRGRVCLSAAGPACMLRAMKAVFLARHHLVDEGLDVSIVPEFGTSDDGSLSVVNIFALAHATGEAI